VLQTFDTAGVTALISERSKCIRGYVLFMFGGA